MSSLKSRLNDRWLYIPIILLGIYLIFRIIDQSQMINVFPLHYTNDSPAYMAMLYFLAKYGYHSLVPNWLNGFVLFQFYPPGWFYFTLPIYYLTKNIQLSTFISLLVILISIFLTIFILGKQQKFSIIKRIAFFLFLFGNSIAIGNFIRLGRLPEIFAWMNFIIICAFILYYKDHEINKNFYWIILPLAVLMLSHPGVIFIFFSSFIWLTFIIIKKRKEKIKIIISFVISLILSSFWWVPFILSVIKEKTMVSHPFFREAILITKDWLPTFIVSFIIPIILWITFYYYWKSKNKSKKELILFGPLILLSILFFFKIPIFIPILKNIFPDIYMFAFMFFSLFFFFSTNFDLINKKLKVLILIFIILFPIISISVSMLHTSNFVVHTELEKDAISLLPNVKERFLVIQSPSPTLYDRAFYAYSAIYYNLSTSSGYTTFGTEPKDYGEKLADLDRNFKDIPCKEIKDNLNYLKTKEIITFDENCNKLYNCGFVQIAKKNNVCLYQIYK